MERPNSLWKWGIFYFNPDDPALFIPKRSGLGYTLNFGRRGSWALMALLLAAILLPLIFGISLAQRR
jgi:uncharacterized membrane protein